MVAPFRRVVVDASMVVEFILRTERGAPLHELLGRAATELCVPSLCDAEVAAALRRLALSGRIGEARLHTALTAYREFPAFRYRSTYLLGRVLQLRRNFTAYDAVYVALAEVTGAELCTCDARLARSVEAHTAVRVV